MDNDKEIGAMSVINSALVELDPSAAARVIRWAAERYKVGVAQTASAERPAPSRAKAQRDVSLSDESEFQSFADLYGAAEPSTDSKRVLVACYWLQALQGETELESQTVNKILKELGYGVEHMPHALDELMSAKPKLLIQTKKQGSARQARRKFKLTNEGIKSVRATLSSISD
jgi:hypothetical protein